eukprot:118978-Rhodomonas_salina.1
MLWANGIAFTACMWFKIALSTPKSPRAMLNSVAVNAILNMFLCGLTRKSQLNTNLDAHSNNIASDLPPQKHNELMMVGDSGANCHFIPTERLKDFMYQVEEIEQEIGGMCSSSQASTMHISIFAGTVMGAKKRDDPQVSLPITSVAFAVKNGKKALFSEVQVCFAGNTILHKGHPKTGTHGIFMQDPKDPKNQFFV